jgi:DUF971 family protein
MSVIETVPHAVEWAPQGLRLHWLDGEVLIEAARLRAACRCAECKAAALQGEIHRPPAGVNLAAAEPVGLYALNLRFSDGHERGIYPWALLRVLATD